jgi:hypothetical protein
MTGGRSVSSLIGGLAALLGMIAVLPSALGQQQAPAEFSTYRLFEGDGPVPNRDDDLQRLAGAIRKAQTPGSCPLGRLNMRVPKDDPLFQEALAAARRDALLGALDRLGLPVAGRLFVETTMFGTPEGHDAVYEIWPDRTPPTLRTTSTPPKGKKVKEGDRIVVTRVARDDADRYQTGIKTVQLVADSEGGRIVKSESYAPCSDPREKRLVATYVVPANPPPIVRLTALAEDHAGLMDKDVGEFPTGDWCGTLEWRFENWVEATAVSSGGASKRVGRADLVLRQKRDGTVEGTLLGSQTYDNWWGYSDRSKYCSWKTAGPQPVRARLDGTYEATRGHPMLQASEAQARIRAELVESHQCSSPPDQSDFGLELASMFPALVHKLERTGENAFAARLDISNVGERSRLDGHYVLTLRRTSD